MRFTKSMFALLTLTIAGVTLTACSQPELVKKEQVQETIQVTHLDTPKHWDFDYTRIDDGKTFQDGGKHCSNFDLGTFKIGAVYKVDIIYYTYKHSDGTLEVRRMTDGCDFFDQPVREVTTA